MSQESDRELLELAARAAGYVLSSEWDCALNGIYIGPGRNGIPFENWNPLEDDGDALRLAARLELAINYGINDVIISRSDYRKRTIAYEEWKTHSQLTDRPVKVRRAIVRAAAEIGRSMKP